jgi:hypothetical protein
MNYHRIYYNIILNRKNNHVNGYTERHHIIPRCLGGDDSNSNIVKLTAREHFLCHFLLSKMYPTNSPQWYKMIHAFAMMKCSYSGQDRYINSKLYESFSIKFKETMSYAQQGTRNSQFGSVWIFSLNEKQNKKNDSGTKIPDGWERGRVPDFDIYFSNARLEQNKIAKKKELTRLKRITRIKKKHYCYRRSAEYLSIKSKVLFKKFKTSELSLRKFACSVNETPMTLSRLFRKYEKEYKTLPRTPFNNGAS